MNTGFKVQPNLQKIHILKESCWVYASVNHSNTALNQTPAASRTHVLSHLGQSAPAHLYLLPSFHKLNTWRRFFPSAYSLILISYKNANFWLIKLIICKKWWPLHTALPQWHKALTSLQADQEIQMVLWGKRAETQNVGFDKSRDSHTASIHFKAQI